MPKKVLHGVVVSDKEDKTIKVLVEGMHRASLQNLNTNKEFLIANIKIYDKKVALNSKVKALSKIVIEQFEEYIKVNKKLPTDLINLCVPPSPGNKPRRTSGKPNLALFPAIIISANIANSQPPPRA